MEAILFNWGLSHTLSKLLPYLLAILLGIFLLRFVLKRKIFKSISLRIVLAILLFLLPFGVYFAINPIYEGDFSQDGKPIMVMNAKTTKMENGLLVLAIPGCPYCFESLAELRKMKARNPKLKIQFAVVGTDDPAVLVPYRKEAQGSFPVELLKGSKALTDETGGRFPSYVMIENGKGVYSWTNNQFGVRAKDRVESW